MRDYRVELRVEAEERQAAERARDAAREREQHQQPKVIWRSRARRTGAR
jgi:hypothetical protein